MEHSHLLAFISREFFKERGIYKYRMKKIIEMDDHEVVHCCHSYCEENDLINEWNIHRKEIESQYCYCPYLEDYIYDGTCYDLQMIGNSMIKPSILPDITIDKEKLNNHCSECKHRL